MKCSFNAHEAILLKPFAFHHAKEERKPTVVVYILVVVGALLLAVLGLILALAILLVGHGGALGVNLLLGGILRKKCRVVN